METTTKTAHIAEALKHLHEASQHMLDAMTEQLESTDGANQFMLDEWQPAIEPVEELAKQMLATVIDDNALRAVAGNNPKWAV